jgi:FtsP/CotA-like multicopper oxidase with cupredoxin domain
VSLPSIPRRRFIAGAGAGALMGLGASAAVAGADVDPEGVAARLEVPPAVAEHYARQDRDGAVTGDVKPGTPSNGGATRTYWIKAVKVDWQIVPTHHDGVYDKPVKGRSDFHGYAYQRWEPGFRKPMNPPAIPGPVIECETGDTVVVNFRNETGIPVTMHPHGIFYTVDMDGAYKGAYTTPSGFVESGRSFQYVWQARPGTEGAWLYHDHGPICPGAIYKGLFGSLIVRDPKVPRPDREFFLTFHSFLPPQTKLDQSFMCVNGHAYAGNTPTLRAKVGDTVAFHVFALDESFHTFHLHGHRWVDPGTNLVIDTKALGPANVMTAQFTEDNPGRWMYHCHVFSHMMMGMIGWYIVEP